MFFRKFFRKPDTVSDDTKLAPHPEPDIRRYFYNAKSLQCYTSWFSYWDGWISAGHCVSEIGGHTPPFANGHIETWPDGLDAALIGCDLPVKRPPDPSVGQDIAMIGYPAGSQSPEVRIAKVYMERIPGQWIAHIFEPDEPVVTGMSGGPVIDLKTGLPIGIIITRNSPADLDNDNYPDESADFIALSSVWDALNETARAPLV